MPMGKNIFWLPAMLYGVEQELYHLSGKPYKYRENEH
jgi:hypothetical protein